MIPFIKNDFITLTKTNCSYLSFEDRISATYRFVNVILDEIVRQSPEIAQLNCAELTCTIFLENSKLLEVLIYSALEKKIPVCARVSSFTIIGYDFTRGNLLP